MQVQGSATREGYAMPRHQAGEAMWQIHQGCIRNVSCNSTLTAPGYQGSGFLGLLPAPLRLQSTCGAAENPGLGEGSMSPETCPSPGVLCDAQLWQPRRSKCTGSWSASRGLSPLASWGGTMDPPPKGHTGPSLPLPQGGRLQPFFPPSQIKLRHTRSLLR